jgi:hypothetical protein
MNYERYPLEADKKLLLFEFTSVGKKGEIKKVVQYTETNLKDYFNLGFGDLNEKTGRIDDHVVTNNGDGQKVLATVASTVYAFFEKYPHAFVYVVGNSEVRTRLYRIGITGNIDEINSDFEVYGLLKGECQEFRKNVN